MSNPPEIRKNLIFMHGKKWHTPKLLDGLNCEFKGEDNGRKKKTLGHVLGLQHFRGRGACYNFGMGLRRLISNSLTHMNLHKPNNKLVSA